jgi:hypothetical protein
MDLSDMFVSLGLFGGFLYAFVVGLTLVMAFRYWHCARSLPALATLGVLVLSFGQWLNGGQYAACALIWLFIGSLDRHAGEAAS